MYKYPENLTVEQIDELVKARANEQRRRWYANKPESFKINRRIRDYSRFLRKNGFDVIPQLPPLPWTKLQEQCILQSLRTNIEQEDAQ